MQSLFFVFYFVAVIIWSNKRDNGNIKKMDLSVAHITDWLMHYGYFAVILFVVLEGPIVTVISGSLIPIGVFNFFLAFFIIVFADLFADCLYYAVGRWGGYKFINRFGYLLGLSAKRVDALKEHFDSRGAETLFLGKISHGIGGIFLTAAGLAKMPFHKFLFYNFIASLIKSFVLLLIGYLFAGAILQINDFFQFFAKISIGTIILIFVIYLYFYRKSDGISD